MDHRALAERIQHAVEQIFTHQGAAMAAREDSRAFGAMIERHVLEGWASICEELGYEPLAAPGKRTIYDAACRVDGHVLGIDVKTKDLDSTRYSDGGVCAVGNLLTFLANEGGTLFVVELGHRPSSEGTGTRRLEYVRVAPIHALPADCYRIENLGTGQVRLNRTIREAWDDIAWERTLAAFFDIFCALAVAHYERVSRDAIHRAGALRRFKEQSYARFGFGRR
jgi:hypothetical protein